MRYWLMKSEPTDFSIDDLETSPNQTIDWYGIRNYQARNFMRDDMSLGDQAFFYHSNCKAPGIVGIMEVSRLAYPDRLQHIKGHKYYDPKSSPDNPRWLNVDVKFVKKTKFDNSVGILLIKSGMQALCKDDNCTTVTFPEI